MRKNKKSSRVFKIIFYALFFISQFTVNIFAQKTSKSDTFELKLNSFRYSLYAYMDTLQDINQAITKNDSINPLQIIVENFIFENKEEIIRYRKSKLEKYLDTDIEFDKFEKDSIFFLEGEPRSEFDQLNSYFTEIQEINAFMQLLTIDPINYAITIQSIYNSRIYSAAEMGRQAIIDRIALPKLKTQEENNGNWKIWIDSYRSLIEFSYNLQKNRMNLMGAYSRRE